MPDELILDKFEEMFPSWYKDMQYYEQIEPGKLKIVMKTRDCIFAYPDENQFELKIIDHSESQNKQTL